MPYRMRGRFLEACDCSVPCPCWFEQAPDDDECTGFIAWQIEEGEIDGVDVSGLTTASVSHHGGHRATPRKVREVLYVDERADDSQRKALERAFSGRLGGPLAELAELKTKPDAVEPAAIRFATDGSSTEVDVGQTVSARTKLLTGATGRPITIGDGVFARLLGTPVESGKATVLRIDLPGRRLVDVPERSTTGGRFAYAHRRRPA